MSAGATRRTYSPAADRGLGVESVCCLPHNLIAGGSARQWIHLLGRHVEQGGRAPIIAPAGPLGAKARRAGIETVDVVWGKVRFDDPEGPWRALHGHEGAIVHWD